MFRLPASTVAGAVLAGMLLPMAQTAESAVVAPSYRGVPNSTLTVFDFDIQNGWGVSDFESVGTAYPLSDMGPAVEVNQIPGTPDEELRFIIPNFIDPLPFKLMRISLECGFTNCGNLEPPVVRGVDPLGSESSFEGQADVPFDSDSGLSGRYFDFVIVPNPDYEEFTFTAAELLQAEALRITVDTISDVPLPAPAALLLAGLAGLGLVARRRAA